jgi:hypothetical protein
VAKERVIRSCFGKAIRSLEAFLVESIEYAELRFRGELWEVEEGGVREDLTWEDFPENL